VQGYEEGRESDRKIEKKGASCVSFKTELEYPLLIVTPPQDAAATSAG